LAGWQLTCATPTDVEPLVALESRCFGWPWGRLSFEGEMASADAESRLAWIEAACGEKRIVAYIFFRFIGEEVHIFRLAVDPEWRRQGIGTRLVAECLTSARRRRLAAAVLEVRPSNTEAIALYRKFGFRVIATRPGYYPDSRENALLLKLELKEEDL
jgi:[ribosomal protein S18]-alanine N-acetyltransferase